MTRAAVLAVTVLLVVISPAYAQSPSGTIVGTVKDATGGVVAAARVTVLNAGTSQSRRSETSEAGLFTTAALMPGRYLVAVEADGFKRVERSAIVEAGTIVSVDVTLELGELSETVTAEPPSSLIRRDHHQIGAVVTREQIDRIPLNGRNFLELAKLEPGVIPSRLADGRTFVSSLGAGLQTVPRVGATRVTVDGVNISTPGTVGVLLQVPQDVVQEFQIATVNFDMATSLTSNGSINIVTRSGTNEFQGTGFYVYRDHRLAAYPGLRRDPANPDPALERHQVGGTAGGPLVRNRLFVFGSAERTDQTSVASVQPLDEFAPLGGLFPSPYAGTQINVRVDASLRQDHTVFARYTSDRTMAFTSVGPPGLPSTWSERKNDLHQAFGGMTSVVSQHLLNELRGARTAVSSPITAATEKHCAGCLGLGGIRVSVPAAGLAFGGEGTSSDLSAWRVQLTDAASWQAGSHTIRFGFDWEHTEATAFNFGMPSEIILFSPGEVRQMTPGLRLPEQFTTPADILQLPLKDFLLTVGSGTVLWEDFRRERVTDLFRLHIADTWRTNGRMTLNAGVSWSYEPNAISQDLSKPALLAPILGDGGLRPSPPPIDNFSAAFGFAWTATADGRTVVRGGGGRYFDPATSTNTLNRARERVLLAPVGTGLLTETGANYLHNGEPLQFPKPTSFTGAQLAELIPSIRQSLLASLAPDNRDDAIRNLDLLKRGTNLVDPSYPTPSAVHLSLGVERDVVRGLRLSADVAWKGFANTFINGIDYNRWNSAGGSILPRCSAAERNDVRAICSNGPMYFDTASGTDRYLGLLVRVEQRFAARAHLLASYALNRFVGTNGTGTGSSESPGGRVFGFNNDNWRENYGPLPSEQRHVVNVSSFIELPARVSLAISVSAYSAPPFAPFVRNIDFNGDGTTSDLLPGTRINQFGRGLNEGDLRRLVERYNAQIAGTRTPTNQIAPFIQLPDSFSFNDGFFTQDVRLTRSFRWGGRGADLFLDVFNLFNTSNLTGFGSDLTERSSFGQPGDRVGQVFGSGGSRAIQIGARLAL